MKCASQTYLSNNREVDERQKIRSKSIFQTFQEKLKKTEILVFIFIFKFNHFDFLSITTKIVSRK